MPQTRCDQIGHGPRRAQDRAHRLAPSARADSGAARRGGRLRVHIAQLAPPLRAKRAVMTPQARHIKAQNTIEDQVWAPRKPAAPCATDHFDLYPLILGGPPVEVKVKAARGRPPRR